MHTSDAVVALSSGRYAMALMSVLKKMVTFLPMVPCVGEGSEPSVVYRTTESSMMLWKIAT